MGDVEIGKLELDNQTFTNGIEKSEAGSSKA